MPQLSKRVGTFTDSVIRRMTRISDEVGAINLSQGFPDFDPPREILDALARVAYEGPHQYSGTFGAPSAHAVREKCVEALSTEFYTERCGGESPSGEDRELLRFAGEQLRQAEVQTAPSESEIEKLLQFLLLCLIIVKIGG